MIFHVIVESGAFYSFAITLALALFVTGSPGVYVMGGIVSDYNQSAHDHAIGLTLQRYQAISNYLHCIQHDHCPSGLRD